MRKSITFLTLEIEIEFDYQPEEKEVRTLSNGDPGYPGYPASVEVSNVYIGKTDITSFFEEIGLMYRLEEQILKEIINSNPLN